MHSFYPSGVLNTSDGTKAALAGSTTCPSPILEDHLFGVARSAFGPVLPGLSELHQGRCFYCDRSLRAPQVDHFLPWARVSLDAIENLVVADEECNSRKTDFLASTNHVERWRQRLDTDVCALNEIAADAISETSPARALALGVARALYLPLPANARLWSEASRLVPANPARLRELLAR